MRRYTPQEDATILKYIQQNPSNLEAAFEVLATKLDRTPGAINNRYYGALKKDNAVIAVASKTGVVHLGKNTIRRGIVPDAHSVRDAMLFASVSKLPKDKAIQFLLDKMSNEAKSNLLIRIANRVGGQ